VAAVDHRHQSDCGRTCLTDKARTVLAARLPERAREPRLRGDGALGAGWSTADSCYAIVGEGASRAMLYVAMTRGRHNNEAFLYQRLPHEADHEHAKPVAAPEIHQTRRGNKHSAAYYFRQILGNDERPARCTPRPNAPSARCFRGGRRGDSTQRGHAAAPAARCGGPTSRRRRRGAAGPSGWPPRRRPEPPASTSTPAAWSSEPVRRLALRIPVSRYP